MSEPFVDAQRAAEHLGITTRQITALARAGKVPAHPLPNGNQNLRRTWRFRISELDAMMGGQK